jgi:hypothetical protein
MSPVSLAGLVVVFLCFFAQASLGVSASLSRLKDRGHANSSLGNSYPYCGDCWCVPDNGGKLKVDNSLRLYIIIAMHVYF